jgi:uncharacterized protein (DUF488 family)
MTTSQATLFTIGHSNQQCARFIDLLQKHALTAIADVRSLPYSQYTPQFNRETLEAALHHRGLKYVFMGRELGARRDERECYVDGQARYDLVRQLPAFAQGLERLRRGTHTQRIALMCSEKDPLTCHRTILICRALRDEMAIAHILEDGTSESHSAAESRLLKLMGLGEGDLFHDRAELLERAYDQQGRAIAYTEPTTPTGDTPKAPA